MPEALDALTGYPALFAFCLFCGLGIPLPEDVPQAWAGMQIAAGKLDWLPALLTVFTAVLARDLVVFGVGRFLGERAFRHPLALRFVGAARIEAARERVRTRGPVAVMIGRFLIGLRVGTFFVAGAMRVSWGDFLLYDGLALLLSAPLLVGAGYLFGEPVIRGVLTVAERMPWLVALVVAVVLVVVLVGRMRGRSDSP